MLSDGDRGQRLVLISAVVFLILIPYVHVPLLSATSGTRPLVTRLCFCTDLGSIEDTEHPLTCLFFLQFVHLNVVSAPA